MKSAARLLLFSALGCPLLATAAPDCANPIGEWKNQLGSILTITTVDTKTGAMTGKYASPSGTGGQPVNLVGWVNQDKPDPTKSVLPVYAFSVQWGAYGSITSWTGYCAPDKAGVPTIVTMWNLARSKSYVEWDHVLTGSDRFAPK